MAVQTRLSPEQHLLLIMVLPHKYTEILEKVHILSRGRTSVTSKDIATLDVNERILQVYLSDKALNKKRSERKLTSARSECAMRL
jgi:hypothetical protein